MTKEEFERINGSIIVNEKAHQFLWDCRIPNGVNRNDWPPIVSSTFYNIGIYDPIIVNNLKWDDLLSAISLSKEISEILKNNCEATYISCPYFGFTSKVNWSENLDELLSNFLNSLGILSEWKLLFKSKKVDTFGFFIEDITNKDNFFIDILDETDDVNEYFEENELNAYHQAELKMRNEFEKIIRISIKPINEEIELSDFPITPIFIFGQYKNTEYMAGVFYTRGYFD